MRRYTKNFKAGSEMILRGGDRSMPPSQSLWRRTLKPQPLTDLLKLSKFAWLKFSVHITFATNSLSSIFQLRPWGIQRMICLTRMNHKVVRVSPTTNIASNPIFMKLTCKLDWIQYRRASLETWFGLSISAHPLRNFLVPPVRAALRDGVLNSHNTCDQCASWV